MGSREKGKLLKIKEDSFLWDRVTGSEKGLTEHVVRSTIWKVVFDWGIDIKVKKLNNHGDVIIDEHLSGTRDDFVPYEGTPGDVAVVLYGGGLLFPNRIARVETRQHNSKKNNPWYHLVATDKTGVEHYIVKFDNITAENAADLVFAITKLVSSSDCEEHSYAYLYNKAFDSKPDRFMLSYFKYIYE